MDAISILFNRAILDVVAGALALGTFNLLVEMLFGLNVNKLILDNSSSLFTLGLTLLGAFLFGHLVDKVAFLLLDHTLFAKHFQTRNATFDLPQWCQTQIEKEIDNQVVTPPTKSRDLVDDSKADWITAFFLTKARQELLVKRADLIANFQFVSNLLVVLVFALFVFPPYLYYRLGDWRYSLASALVLLIFCLGYWRFSVAALRRINTFENLAVFGILMDEKRQLLAEKSQAKSTDQQPQHVAQNREGTVPKPLATLFGDRENVRRRGSQ